MHSMPSNSEATSGELIGVTGVTLMVDSTVRVEEGGVDDEGVGESGLSRLRFDDDVAAEFEFDGSNDDDNDGVAADDDGDDDDGPVAGWRGLKGK